MEKRIKIDAMPAHVAATFYDYLALPQRRSLDRLAAIYRGRCVGPSIATLKRWSKCYQFQALAAQYDKATVISMEQHFMEARGAKIRSDAAAIAAAKKRFYDRVDLDPDDPLLTPRQRSRALRPTLADFRRLIKLELLLLPQLHHAGPENPPAGGETFTTEEMEAMLTALNRVRHNLPG